MESNSNSPTFASASGALLACAVVLLGAWRNVPILSLIIRAVVLGTVASFCIQIMQRLIRESSEEKPE